MKKEVNFCDSCDKPLFNDTDGYIVQGSIYFLNDGGLIGNAFKKVANNAINLDDVEKYTFCKECLKKVLYLD